METTKNKLPLLLLCPSCKDRVPLVTLSIIHNKVNIDFDCLHCKQQCTIPSCSYLYSQSSQLNCSSTSSRGLIIHCLRCNYFLSAESAQNHKHKDSLMMKNDVQCSHKGEKKYYCRNCLAFQCCKCADKCGKMRHSIEGFQVNDPREPMSMIKKLNEMRKGCEIIKGIKDYFIQEISKMNIKEKRNFRETIINDYEKNQSINRQLIEVVSVLAFNCELYQGIRCYEMQVNEKNVLIKTIGADIKLKRKTIDDLRRFFKFSNVLNVETYDFNEPKKNYFISNDFESVKRSQLARNNAGVLEKKMKSLLDKDIKHMKAKRYFEKYKQQIKSIRAKARKRLLLNSLYLQRSSTLYISMLLWRKA